MRDPSRLILIMPPHEHAFLAEGYFLLPPLSLGLLRGFMLGQGFAVDIADLSQNIARERSQWCREQFAFCFRKDRVFAYIRGDGDKEIQDVLARLMGPLDLSGYGTVGVSIGSDFSLFQIHLGYMLARYIQEALGARVVIGGNNVVYTFLFRKAFAELWTAVTGRFPWIIKGPGHVALRAIAALPSGATPSVPVPGLVRTRGGELEAEEEVEPWLGRPDFGSLDLGYYAAYLEKGDSPDVRAHNEAFCFKWPSFLSQYVNSVRRKRNPSSFEPTLIIPYLFNYHCAFRCAFCTESDPARRKLIKNGIEAILDDLEVLAGQYGSRYFYFLNNTFNVTPGFCDRFCRAVEERKLEIYWSDCARFNGMTRERLVKMKSIGCRKLTFGFETASPKILKYVDKRLDLEHAEQVLRWCHEIGIWADLEVIVGFPYEYEEDLRETERFIERNAAVINFMTINTYFLVPNSLMGLHPERYGIELIDNPKAFPLLLQRNEAFFYGNKEPGGKNFALVDFRQVDNGRTSDQIREGIGKHIAALYKLQSREFREVEYVYRIKDQLHAR